MIGRIRAAAGSSLSVLLLGGSGTGTRFAVSMTHEDARQSASAIGERFLPPWLPPWRVLMPRRRLLLSLLGIALGAYACVCTLLATHDYTIQGDVCRKMVERKIDAGIFPDRPSLAICVARNDSVRRSFLVGLAGGVIISSLAICYLGLGGREGSRRRSDS